ncbi:hypothetical protein BJX63DRAFT_137076 [Aspergillus granulosus]|uniref:C3H1-type domain-containing protein n=1 Tax=Aspergillus granulosus TaxID=176169 RepID=A0ABR4HMC2_9EURO
MLGDGELQALNSSLKTVTDNNQRHHQELHKLLDQFQFLLESYNRLKSDYEEEKEGRERYKKLARAQERNPFILVLVDGDGYLFKEYLIKAGAEGGVKAARLLNDSIKDLAHERLGIEADQCRIMVRIYSNVLGLSRAMARQKLVGNEARSLSMFTSSFTRAQDLFDYIDAGDKKEGADYKIREIFRLFADNNQCKHIFFAGCHDTGYLSLITPYRGKADRITLIKAASFHPEFERLDLPVRELPSVFMSTQTPGNRAPSPTISIPAAPKICTFYQKGICRYGSSCKKIHIMPGQQLSKTSEPSTRPSISSWRDKDNSNVREMEFYAENLPYMNAKALDFIPVNKDGERIDIYVPPPSPEVWELYVKRSKVRKLCNNYHLGGGCDNENCEFDHSAADSNSLNVMKYILRQHVCTKGARCRLLNCYVGHHCQKGGCRGIKPCRFGRRAHTLDVTVAQWEVPVEQSTSGDSSVSVASIDDDWTSSWAFDASPIECSY